ncbi:hypothetical protein LguiB_004172 [Lonicera macranthoides]
MEIIVSFDLRDEVFGQMVVPDSCGFDDEIKSELVVLKGSLSVIFYSKNEENDICFEIWVMTEQGVEESWTRLFTNVNFNASAEYARIEMACENPRDLKTPGNNFVLEFAIPGPKNSGLLYCRLCGELFYHRNITGLNIHLAHQNTRGPPCPYVSNDIGEQMRIHIQVLNENLLKKQQLSHRKSRASTCTCASVDIFMGKIMKQFRNSSSITHGANCCMTTILRTQFQALELEQNYPTQNGKLHYLGSPPTPKGANALNLQTDGQPGLGTLRKR